MKIIVQQRKNPGITVAHVSRGDLTSGFADLPDAQPRRWRRMPAEAAPISTVGSACSAISWRGGSTVGPWRVRLDKSQCAFA
ncbi:hypothetical protein [Ensifer sp. ENS10]|uniref:hypothetical protein n=1 Tax=Ensifer sp. ENS10 TaxID=2769286 RepID=UPI001AEF00DF|nr:hypothetical protein [Ensifer sp. ENS10]